MKIINLLPQSELNELRLRLSSKKFTRFFTIIIGSLISFFVLALALSFYIESSIAASNADITRLQDQLSSSNNQALEKQVLNLNTQIRNIRNIRERHYYWSQALIELGNVVPQGLHIDSLSVDRGSGKIDIAGVAANREDVLLFWSNVKKSQYFTNINFPLNNLEKAAETPYTFSFFVKPEMIKEKK